jgi:hypothetical protein
MADNTDDSSSVLTLLSLFETNNVRRLTLDDSNCNKSEAAVSRAAVLADVAVVIILEHRNMHSS